MNEYFDLILDSPNALIQPKALDYETICVRIMAHLNPAIVDNGHLLPLIGKRFKMGWSDHYEIRMTEGVVGYPERMAVMATCARVYPNTTLSEHE